LIHNSDKEEFAEVVFKVKPHHSGLRLDEFLKASLHRYSRNEIHTIIESKLVQKERRLRKASIVRTGDEFILLYPKKEEIVKDIEIPVIFEDEHILIVNEPHDMSVHSTNPWGKNDLIQQLRRQRKDNELFLAHRIDRETSGIVLISRSTAISRKLGEAFSGRDVEKEYMALVFGEIASDKGTIDLPICQDEKSAVKIKMTTGDANGAPSITDYTVLKRFNGFTMVRARPKTGRQHQIRVHFSAIGHPLVGDKIYKDEKLFLKFIKDGFTEELGIELISNRHALHASSLSFIHPITGIRLNVEAELPEDLRVIIKILE